MESTMARQQRSDNRTFAQRAESLIVRVALYARVSTLNNQDPEMQLCELREYAARGAGKSRKSTSATAFLGARSPGRHLIDSCPTRADDALMRFWSGRLT